jgi:hypothetical protein
MPAGMSCASAGANTIAPPATSPEQIATDAEHATAICRAPAPVASVANTDVERTHSDDRTDGVDEHASPSRMI